MIVLDAGAFLELLFRSDAGLRVEESPVDADVVAAPELLDAEVLHRVVQLAEAARLRDALSGHDALYAATAVVLGAPLLTADGRLARTLRGRLRGPASAAAARRRARSAWSAS